PRRPFGVRWRAPTGEEATLVRSTWPSPGATPARAGRHATFNVALSVRKDRLHDRRAQRPNRLHLLRGAVPEQADEISLLWSEYTPAVEVAASTTGTTINANR